MMSGKLGPVRTGSELEGAVLELEGLRHALTHSMTVAGGEKRYSRERMDALEVPLMIETALMIASSARMRTESRGSHFRTDYPEKDEAWIKNISVRRAADGRMSVCTSPVVQECEE